MTECCKQGVLNNVPSLCHFYHFLALATNQSLCMVLVEVELLFHMRVHTYSYCLSDFTVAHNSMNIKICFNRCYNFT
jgi:hypothetical protein